MCDEQTVKDLIARMDLFKPEEGQELVKQIIECGDVAAKPVVDEFGAGKKTSEKEWLLQALEGLFGREPLIEWLLRYLDRMRGFTRYYSLEYLYEHGDRELHESLIPYMIEDIGGHFYCNKFAREKLAILRDVSYEPVMTAFHDQIKNLTQDSRNRFSDLILVIQALNDTRAISSLIKAMNAATNNSDYRTVAFALMSMGKEAAPSILEMVSNDSLEYEKKLEFVKVLKHIPSLESVPILISLLDHENDEMKWAAIRALGPTRDKRATPHLIKLLQSDKNETTRYTAASALGNIRDPDAKEPLIEAMLTDSQAEVRRLAAHALRYYSGPHVLEALIKALQDPEEIVPIWARYALDERPEEARPYLQKLHQEQPEIIERAYNTWPWDLLDECRNDIKLQKEVNSDDETSPHEFYSDRAHDCPICGKPAADLSWFFITTPEITWQKLMGREGWQSVCDDCHVQVDFFMTAMN